MSTVLRQNLRGDKLTRARNRMMDASSAKQDKFVCSKSSRKPTSSDKLRMYAKTMPNDHSDADLEQLITNRIKETTEIQVTLIKCYSRIGIVVIDLASEIEKQRLLGKVKSIVLDSTARLTLSFLESVDLDSYVVVDKSMQNMPSEDFIMASLITAFKTSEINQCKSVSIQFPNIFRIESSDINAFDFIAEQAEVKIGGCLATVYVGVDCSFFEDLPTTTDENFSSSISSYVDPQPHRSGLFYAQYDRETNSAVVLMPRSNEKWRNEGSLELGGKKVSKKRKLAYRVVVSPVPQTFDIYLILNHDIFACERDTHKHINDRLIVEFSDLKAYERCLDRGALKIGKQLMSIEKYCTTSDPDNAKLDAFNWYETEMLQIEPNIVTMINNPQHPIFRYMWSEEDWLEQFTKLASLDRRSKNCDLVRHLLRVTVMLNTMGILRKKWYKVQDQKVELTLQKLQTIGYDHQSKLLPGKTIPVSDLKPPFSSTKVIVRNEDCLGLYQTLCEKGYRPVLLNMANAHNPGGGYRKGDGAQEENLFRRSDYYHSLDLDIADKDRSDINVCTPQCQVKRKRGCQDLYPMEDFGAIYTAGITVFRGTEAKGYPLMQQPLYHVCSIAMAAYREPKLNSKNMLEKKFATNTRKKIENIFAIAYHQKHDCLVLSALGCGAFKNPPEHVALLFKSVIYQYAGYFKKICFAIIDDHNTGNLLNPRGNFIPFKEKLDNLVVHPPNVIQKNGFSGPYRILNKSEDDKLTLSDVCIQDFPPCHHGTECRDMRDLPHAAKFSHPPICLYQLRNARCDQMNDEVHTFTFLHKIQCTFGGECRNSDSTHLDEFEHPDFCEEKSGCTNTNTEHLRAYRHVPLCPGGFSCIKYQRKDAEHLNGWRHCKIACQHDNCCPNFNDEEHVKNTLHSFQEPCPFTPYHCRYFKESTQPMNGNISETTERHCLKYSHVCLYGRFCNETEDHHYERFVHIPRKLCPDDPSCPKITDEIHLQSFSHTGIRDIRLLCKFPGYECRNRWNEKHTKIYRHVNDVDYLGVAPSRNLNDGINFYRNQGAIIRRVNTHVDSANWKKAKVSDDLLNWIRALQPIHRCGPKIFESILVHGHVMSRDYMIELAKPRCVADAVMQHPQIRLILLRHNTQAARKNLKELITLFVKSEFLRAGSAEVQSLDSDHDHQINVLTKKLQPPFDERDVSTIYHKAADIAAASLDLNTHFAGLGFPPDKLLRTNKHVFSVLGPHSGFIYGDIVIVFKQELMFHPDANFSVQAGTSFISGRTYGLRPWWKDPTDLDKRIQEFHRAKLHCSFPRYEYAAAIELSALMGATNGTMDVDLATVVSQWKRKDSHDVFEGHLPSLIPLDYVESVYIPQNLFHSLSPGTQNIAKNIFKESLIVAPHPVDLNLIKPKGVLPLDDTRKPYLQYILDTLCQKIEDRMKNPNILRGFVITLPGTQHSQLLILPITITQSHDLFCLNKAQTRRDIKSTYIYWQAKHGDIMLTLTNEKIDPRAADQPNLHCLICFVAEKPKSNLDDYQEPYSYLTTGSPYSHENYVSTNKFKAKSNRFYRGCNTDDFFTFCLKISYNTGEVTLTHAGPNGIYNHAAIQYRFKNSELELSILDYIYISAGNQDVPIRNLIVDHEPILAFHPDIDKSFKLDTSRIVQRRRASIHHDGRRIHASRYLSEVDRKSKATPKRSMSVNNVQQKSDSDAQPRSYQSFTLSMPPRKSFLSRIKRFVYDVLGISSKPMQKSHSTKSLVAKDIQPAFPNDKKLEHVSLEAKPHEPKASTYKPSRRDSSSPEPTRDKPSKVRLGVVAPLALISSKLPPCRNSIYCLQQCSREHTDQFSHPCRFNQLCTKQASEPHLAHKRLDIPMCMQDRHCSERVNPIHRAEYRHTGLPDYLIPCRFQENCYNRDSEHRLRFFHGEEIPSIKSKSDSDADVVDRT